MTETATPAPVEKDLSLRLKLAAYFALPMLLLASMLLVIPLIVMAVVAGRAPADVNIVGAVIATVVAELIVIAVALAWGGQWKRAKEVLGFKNFRWKTVGIGLAVGVVFQVGLQLIAIVLAQVGGPVESSDTSESLTSLDGAQGLLVLLLLVPLLVPLVEEIFFRGYVLGFLMKAKHGDKVVKPSAVKSAIFWSSLFFALAHFQGASSITDFFIVIWIFFFAIGNAVLRIRTDSIYPAYAAHLAYNLATSLLIVAAM